MKRERKGGGAASIQDVGTYASIGLSWEGGFVWLMDEGGIRVCGSNFEFYAS